MSATGAQGALFGATPARAARLPKQTTTTVTVSADAIAAVMARRTTGERVIAEAVRVARPEVRNVAVDLGSIRWTDPTSGRRAAFPTPAVVRAALLALDRGAAPGPFRFVIGRMVMIRGEA